MRSVMKNKNELGCLKRLVAPLHAHVFRPSVRELSSYRLSHTNSPKSGPQTYPAVPSSTPYVTNQRGAVCSRVFQELPSFE